MSWAEPEQMTADGDIYYATVRGLAEGSTINYKFINGTEWESVSGACSVGDDNNVITSYSIHYTKLYE